MELLAEIFAYVLLSVGIITLLLMCALVVVYLVRCIIELGTRG